MPFQKMSRDAAAWLGAFAGALGLASLLLGISPAGGAVRGVNVALGCVSLGVAIAGAVWWFAARDALHDLAAVPASACAAVTGIAFCVNLAWILQSFGVPVHYNLAPLESDGNRRWLWPVTLLLSVVISAVARRRSRADKD